MKKVPAIRRIAGPAQIGLLMFAARWRPVTFSKPLRNGLKAVANIVLFA